MTRNETIIKKVTEAIKECDAEHTICIVKRGHKFLIVKVENWLEDSVRRRFNIIKWFSNDGRGSKDYPNDVISFACEGI